MTEHPLDNIILQMDTLLKTLEFLQREISKFQWIKCSDRKPTQEDSPILAVESLLYFATRALHYLDGWDGPGWYDASDEYGMGLNENEAHYHQYSGMIYWMPLPKSPEAK